MKPKNDFQHVPCPICGERDYAFGYSAPHYGQRLIGLRQRIVNARHCQTCGNVQYFLDETTPQRTGKYVRQVLLLTFSIILGVWILVGGILWIVFSIV